MYSTRNQLIDFLKERRVSSEFTISIENVLKHFKKLNLQIEEKQNIRISLKFNENFKWSKKRKNRNFNKISKFSIIAKIYILVLREIRTNLKTKLRRNIFFLINQVLFFFV